MSKTGLLSPSEVIRWTPVQLPFNPCTLRELYGIEYEQAKSCLGLQLWQAMIDALADYSEATYYNADTTYQIDDVVIWNGGYRIATAPTTQIPDDITTWKDAPKFDVGNDCGESYEDFYCIFYGPWMAYVVLSERLPYIVTQLTDQGITYGGRKYNIQDKALIESLQKAIYRDRERAYRRMYSYLMDQSNNDCFGFWIGKEKEDEKCGCNKKGCEVCNPRPQYVGRYRVG